MSGNSSRSSSQIAPIVRSDCPGASVPRRLVAKDVIGRRSSLQEGQAVLADLDLVVVGELSRLDPVSVDVRPVQASEVADGEGLAGALELCVAARDRHV